jgi:hypothetical protein
MLRTARQDILLSHDTPEMNLLSAVQFDVFEFHAFLISMFVGMFSFFKCFDMCCDSCELACYFEVKKRDAKCAGSHFSLHFCQVNSGGETKHRSTSRGAGVAGWQFGAHEPAGTGKKLRTVFATPQWSLYSQITPFSPKRLPS